MNTEQIPGTYAARLESIELRLAAGAERMDRSEEALRENTRMTREVHAQLPAMRQVFEMLKTWEAGMNSLAAFGRGLGWCGRKLYALIKFLTPIAAFIGTVIALWHVAFPHKGP